MLGVALADNADDALSFDDFAVLANRLYARTNLHTYLPGRVSGVANQYKGGGNETQVKVPAGYWVNLCVMKQLGTRLGSPHRNEAQGVDF
jgi:hypothetical protein